jgi:predicted RNA-binding protein Jag
MEELQNKIKNLIELMGFTDFTIEAPTSTNLIVININDGYISPDRLPGLVANFNSLVRLMAKKLNIGPVMVDINNYRKERERLIIEIAKAAARRVLATKESISLPVMNAYERRLVHAELSAHPDIKTESVGEGRGRYVVVKII